MAWGDLSWLAEHGYQKMYERGEYHRETWILRDDPARNPAWHEVVVAWTGDDEGQEFVQVSAGLLDDNSCLIYVSIDKVKFDDLRRRLKWYERRVLQMLRVGLDSATAV
jgi:hypothetical protein